MREYYPELALFVTEFGAESNRKRRRSTRRARTRSSATSCAITSKTYIKKRYLNGAIAWVLKDFRSRPDWEGGNPTPQPPWNQKGLADARWHKKPAFDALAKLYKSVPPVAAQALPLGTSR